MKILVRAGEDGWESGVVRRVFKTNPGCKEEDEGGKVGKRSRVEDRATYQWSHRYLFESVKSDCHRIRLVLTMYGATSRPHLAPARPPLPGLTEKLSGGS